MTTPRDFRGKVVVVTGAAGGLGRALVHAFAQVGAQVAALDRDAAALAVLAQETAGTPDDRRLRCHPPGRLPGRHRPRVRTPGRRGPAHQQRRHCPPQRLCRHPGGRAAPRDGRELFGAAHCTHAALPSLRQRRGMVVAIPAWRASPLIGRTGYAASKHALQRFL